MCVDVGHCPAAKHLSTERACAAVLVCFDLCRDPGDEALSVEDVLAELGLDNAVI